MKPTLKLLLGLLFIFFIKTEMWAGNTCNSATPIANNLGQFETHTNLGTTNSGVPAPPCGDYISNDFWFSTTVPATGFLSVVLLPGSMTNPALAVYSGSCSNLNLMGCSSEDLCGNASAALYEENGLTPGTTVYIRVWAVGGAPNGDFEIRVSNANPPPAIPLGLDILVGTASNNGDCVQLTTAINAQLGCAWDSEQHDMTQTFEKVFLLNFGNNDGGADGITVGFQNSPAGTSACGVGGGGIGAQGITNSFIVEFDTWDNGAAVSDIVNDHAAIYINGAVGTATPPLDGPVSLNGGNIEDGQDHIVRIKWNGTTLAYEVHFDEVLIMSGTYDIITNCLGGNPLAYWGTTSSTGGANNNQSICPYTPDPYYGGIEQIVDVTICEGESYFAGGANQTTSGVYSDSTPLTNGCQSVTTTNLTVTPNGTSTVNETVCLGDCVTIGTDTYCNAGTFMTTLPNANYLGCDSIVTLNLTVLSPQSIINQNPQPIIDCTNPTVFLDGSASSSSGSTFYQWTGPCILNGEFTPVAEVICSGVYTLTVTQVEGNVICVNSSTIEVFDNAILPIADAGSDQVLDCSTGCTFLNATMSSNGINIIYSWTGPNGFSSNLQNPEVCEAGNYTLTVYNTSNNCVSGDVVMVTGSSAPIADAGNDGAIDCTSPTATLDGSNSDMGTGFTLIWQDVNGVQVGTGPILTTSDPGIYTLIVTNTSNGCSTTDDVIVSGNTNLPNANAGTDFIINCNNPMGFLDGSNSDMGTGFTLVWQDANGVQVGTGAVLTTSEPGTYTLIVTNTANGCSATDEAVISGNSTLPNADAGADFTIDCNNISANLDGSNSDMGTGFTLIWQDASGMQVGSGANFNTTTPGTYTLVVTNTTNGCSSTDEAIISEDSTPPNADAGADFIIDCSNPTGSLDGSNSDSGTGFTLVWQDINGMQVGSGPILNTATAGTYTLIVTNTSNGCSATDEAVISGNSNLPSVDAGADFVIDCNNPSANLDGSNSDTGTDFSLIWQDASGMQVGSGTNFNTTTPGTYTLVVTNTTNGCSSTDEVIITGNTTPPNADAGADFIIDCNNPSANLDGSNSDTGTGFSLVWQDANGLQVGTGSTLNTLNTGTYTLIVTNTVTGCSATDNALIVENNALPNANAGADFTIDCSNTTATLDGSGSDMGTNFSLVWQDANGLQVGTGSTLNTLNTGTYTLVVTNTSTGCFSTDEAIVSGTSNLPTADAGAMSTLTCEVLDVTLNGSNSSTGSNFSYEWQNSMGDSLGNNLLLNVSDPDTYTLIVTDNSNGCTQSSTVTIDQNITPPNADAGTGGILSCTATSITLDGSNSSQGGFNYNWFNSNNTNIGSGAMISISSSDTFTLVVTSTTNGCSASDEVIITQDTNVPTATANSDGDLTCANIDVTLDGTGSSSGADIIYEWFDNQNISLGGNISINTSESGTYTFVVTDNATGCSSATDVVVMENLTEPTVIIQNPSELTCNNLQSTLNGSSSSSGINFTYEWFDSDNLPVGNGSIINVSEAGFYTLVVTNSTTGCSNLDSIEVTQDGNVPMANIDLNTTTLNCNNVNILLQSSGSSIGTDIVYAWSDANGVLSTASNWEITTPGDYTLTVSNNANGCSSSTSVSISQDTIAPQIVTNAETITCDLPNSILDGTGSSIGANIVYEWQNNMGSFLSNDITFEVDQSGNYNFIVTNNTNGCSSSEVVTVDENITNVISNAGNNATLTCGTTSVQLDGSNSTSSATIDYQWINAAGVLQGNDPILDAVTADTFYLIVTDTQNGCADTSSAIVAQDSNLPTPIITNDGILTCINEAVNLDGSTSTGIGTLDFAWTDPNGFSILDQTSINAMTIGNYELVVTDQSNGCSATVSFLVEENIDAPFSDAGQNDTIDCNVTMATLDGSNSDTGADYSYEWIAPNGTPVGNLPILNTDESGIFTLTITNNINGCTAISTAEVIQSSDLPTAIISPPNTITCALSSVDLIGSLSTGVGQLSYQWYNSTGQEIGVNPTLNVSQSGTYSLDVTDSSNGCVSSTSVLVEDNLTPPIAGTNNDGTLTCTQTSYEINASNSSIGSNFQYEWLDPTGVTISNNFSYDAADIGFYNLIVTDISNGCNASASIEITENLTPPDALPTANGVLTCINLEVELEAIIAAATSYEWFDPAGNSISTATSILVDEVGLYELVATDSGNGCTAAQQVLVEENNTPPTPSIDALTNLNLSCDQNSLVVDASNSTPIGNVTYEWTLNNILISTDPNPQIDEAGTLMLTVTDTQNGCSESTSVTITQDNDLPIIEFENPDLLTCAVTSLDLDATNSSMGTDFEYLWTGPGTIQNPTALTPTISQSGTYTLTILNTSNGCEVSDEISVGEDVTPPVAIISPADEFDCTTLSVALDASNSSVGNNFTYQWITSNGNISGNPNSINTTVSQVGIYTLEITNTINGCTTSESITVNADNNVLTSAEFLINQPLCFGDQGSIIINNIIGGTAPYLYSIDNQPFIDNPNFSSLEPGNYTILIEDAQGCQYEEEITVLEAPELIVELPESATIRLGEDYELQPYISYPLNALESLIWTPSDSLSCDTCLYPIANPTNSTFYTLTAINLNGCKATTGMWVYVEKPRNVFIPNVFTPNDDGFNDIFYINAEDLMIKQVNKFQIFTRWGELVFTDEDFQPNTPDHGWDGFFKGEKLNPSVFVYYAEIEFIDGLVKVYKGDVTLQK